MSEGHPTAARRVGRHGRRTALYAGLPGRIAMFSVAGEAAPRRARSRRPRRPGTDG